MGRSTHKSGSFCGVSPSTSTSGLEWRARSSRPCSSRITSETMIPDVPADYRFSWHQTDDPNCRLRRNIFMAMPSSTLARRIQDLSPELERVYADIHAHPELSM